MKFTNVFKKVGFSPLSVDDVMASFNDMIVSLEAIEELQIDEIERQNKAIQEAATKKGSSSEGSRSCS